MTVDSTEARSGGDAAGEASPGPDRPDPTARPAAVAFGVYLAVCGPLLLFVLGRHLWFFHDEWAYIIVRRDDSLGELFEPHNLHWTTLPILVFKAAFGLVGVRSYVPYQVAVVVAHLGAALLLRVVMRRAGVRPWMATLVAGTFVLLGSGERNIVGAFQITFTGALVFGLAHLVLLDHDGPVDRRDAIGLVAGALALMFSGVGLVMALSAGVAALLRRGWRVALLHTAPLAAMYLTWYLVHHPGTPIDPEGRGAWTVAREVVDFGATAGLNAFEGMGDLPGVGILLGVVLVVGLVLAWSPLSLDEFRRWGALPAALLIGGAAFLLMTGLTRWTNPQNATASRYVHLVVAFALPALAVAVDAICRRWRVATPAIVVLLLLGVPGNIGAFGHDGARTAAYFDHQEQLFRALAVSPDARRVPPQSVPQPDLAGRVRIGWLVAVGEAGDLPAPGEIDPAIAAEVEVRLGLGQRRQSVGPSGDRECRELGDPAEWRPAVNDVLTFDGEIEVTNLAVPPRDRLPVAYDPSFGPSIVVQLPDLVLEVRARRPADPVAICW